MATRRPGEPYGPAYAGRVLHIVREIEQRTDYQGWVPLPDDDRYTIRVRAIDESDNSLALSATLAQSTDAQGRRWVAGYVPLGATATDAPLRWEIVAEDTDTADADGLNDHATLVLEEWRQRILAKPPEA